MGRKSKEVERADTVIALLQLSLGQDDQDLTYTRTFLFARCILAPCLVLPIVAGANDIRSDLLVRFTSPLATGLHLLVVKPP